MTTSRRTSRGPI